MVPVGNRDLLNTNQPPTEGIEGTPSFSETNQKKHKSIASQNKQKNGQSQQEDEEDDEEEEEEEPSIRTKPRKDPDIVDTDSDFSLIEPPIMTPTSEADAHAATELLAGKVPVELVSDILDHAEYFAHQTLATREDALSVSDGTKLYLTAKIPDFTALEKDTAGKGGAEGAGGRPGRVRKIVFRFKSNDQGWSSNSRDYGTYRASWSWLDVEVWRKREEGPPKDGDEGGMFRVLESLLQRNKHAESDAVEYEISWRWDQDKLGENDEGKWEPGVVNELGETTEGAWEKGGHHERNGEFVRELKGGDEVRVLIKALYPGWRCTVEQCAIECWWAV
ncbi:hypothetical protein TWF281_001165 [Arthrobotrys megalospora]